MPHPARRRKRRKKRKRKNEKRQKRKKTKRRRRGFAFRLASLLREGPARGLGTVALRHFWDGMYIYFFYGAVFFFVSSLVFVSSRWNGGQWRGMARRKRKRKQKEKRGRLPPPPQNIRLASEGAEPAHTNRILAHIEHARKEKERSECTRPSLRQRRKKTSQRKGEFSPPPCEAHSFEQVAPARGGASIRAPRDTCAPPDGPILLAGPRGASSSSSSSVFQKETNTKTQEEDHFLPNLSAAL